MVKRRQKSLLVGIAVGFAFLAGLVQTNNHYLRYGISDWVAWFGSIGDHAHTRFAPGFSETRFSKIRQGMTQPDVQRLLGEPLRKWPWSLWGPSRSDEFWDYSLPASNVWNYHRRAVIFDPEQKVFLVDRSYYCDDCED
jgi:hypothetical protein